MGGRPGRPIGATYVQKNQRSPLKRDIPNKYSLWKVYMGLMRVPSQGYYHFPYEGATCVSKNLFQDRFRNVAEQLCHEFQRQSARLRDVETENTRWGPATTEQLKAGWTYWVRKAYQRNATKRWESCHET